MFVTKQHSLIMTYSMVQQAGVLFRLKDAKGGVVATFAPSKPYQPVVFSSPLPKEGQTHTLYSGGKSSGVALDGVYAGGACQNGTKVSSTSP